MIGALRSNGAEIGMRDIHTIVASSARRMPAQKSGSMPRQDLLINGESSLDLSVREAFARSREKGTKVTLTIIRGKQARHSTSSIVAMSSLSKRQTDEKRRL
jgi:C-terminal processing protease CtpA/Prc